MFTVLAQVDGTLTETVLFYLFAVMSGGAALAVVVSRNIVRMSVALLFTLVGAAGLYFLLHAEFLAAVQLVVYAGGTLILIIFGVMLTSKSPFSRFEPKASEVVIALCAGVILLGASVSAIVHWVSNEPRKSGPAVATEDAYPLAELGQALLGDYLVPFEIVSVLLLCVMIGAAYLAKGRRDGSRGMGGGDELSGQARHWT
jgi:NADH-quinone oxidoreductase subunit J